MVGGREERREVAEAKDRQDVERWEEAEDLSAALRRALLGHGPWAVRAHILSSVAVEFVSPYSFRGPGFVASRAPVEFLGLAVVLVVLAPLTPSSSSSHRRLLPSPFLVLLYPTSEWHPVVVTCVALRGRSLAFHADHLLSCRCWDQSSITLRASAAILLPRQPGDGLSLLTPLEALLTVARPDLSPFLAQRARRLAAFPAIDGSVWVAPACIKVSRAPVRRGVCADRQMDSAIYTMCTACSSSGVYIADRCYGRFLLKPSVSTRFFHSTGQHFSIEKDYYKILGVSKDASQDDIKKAFHFLAKKYHPDTNRGNTAAKRTFQEIRDAYETLRDPSKRQQYDMLFSRVSEGNSTRDSGDFDGSYQDPFSGFSKQNHNPFAEFDKQNNGSFSSKFYKIFSEVFQHDVDVHANDIEVEVNLSFYEAAKGCMKQVPLRAKNLCNSCDGLGYLANARKYACPSCKGEGRISKYPFTSVCSTCRGFGKVTKDYCLTCEGSGVLDGMKYINVTIPAGVDSGDTIHVPEAGNSGGNGALPGNLYIKLRVASDPVFVRDGPDIHVDKKISFTQAMLGGKIEVPTIDGKTEVKIPKGVQPGHVLVLRGKGLPNRAGYLGDQHVRFRIHFPSVVNDRQRALLEEFAVEEAMKEHSSFAAGNWSELLVENMKNQTFILGLGFAILIYLILGKAAS